MPGLPHEGPRSAAWASGPNAVLPVFAAYQQARIEFAQEVAKLALPDDPKANQNASAPGGTYEVDGAEKVLNALEQSYHLLNDMRPLVNDQAPAVRENAMVAMGRLSSLSTKLHEQIASEEETLLATVQTIAQGTTPTLLKAALYLLHSSVKDSAANAGLAVESNALTSLSDALESSDSSVKAAACWCIGGIAGHDAALASAVVDSGCLSLLVQCLKEPSLPLRRVALACLGQVAKHEQGLAEAVHKENATSAAVGFLTHKDFLLRRQACRLLAVAIQHHDAAADWVPAAVRPNVLATVRDADGETGAFAATVVQQLAKRSTSAATGLVELGAVQVLVQHIAIGDGSPAPAAAALGHICDASADAAVAAVEAGAISAIKPVLASRAPPQICAVLCACLGAIGKASEALGGTIATSGALQLMAEATILSGRKMGPATLALARKGIGKAVSKCGEYSVLVWLIEALADRFKGPRAEHAVLAAVIKAMARLLGNKGNLRLDFMQRGALTLAQDAAKSGSAELKEALKQLNTTYPSQMVAATDPAYEASLLAKIQ